MADVTISEPPPHTSSTTTVEKLPFDSNPEINHDWVYRQMKLYRGKYIEPIKITIKVISWNVNGKRLSEDLLPLLDESVQPGIYAIGYIAKIVLNVDSKKWILGKGRMSCMIPAMK